VRSAPLHGATKCDREGLGDVNADTCIARKEFIEPASVVGVDVRKHDGAHALWREAEPLPICEPRGAVAASVEERGLARGLDHRGEPQAVFIPDAHGTLLYTTVMRSAFASAAIVTSGHRPRIVRHSASRSSRVTARTT
jgi:hypothetical protein